MERKQNKHTSTIIGFKVGRLKYSIARAIHVRCADIYLTENTIKHIANNHKRELTELGVSVSEYVCMIVRDFNQIRQGSNGSLLLVVYHEGLSHVAAIRMNYCTKKGVWEVATAQPRDKNKIQKSQLLWE